MKFDFRESRNISTILLSNNIAQCDERAARRPHDSRLGVDW